MASSVAGCFPIPCKIVTSWLYRYKEYTFIYHYIKEESLSLQCLQLGIVSENVLWQVSQLVVTQVPDKNLCEIRGHGLIQTNSKLRINI